MCPKCKLKVAYRISWGPLVNNETGPWTQVEMSCTTVFFSGPKQHLMGKESDVILGNLYFFFILLKAEISF